MTTMLPNDEASVADRAAKPEIAQLKSKIAALEQLLDVHETTSLEQGNRLEQALREREDSLRRARAEQSRADAAELWLRSILGQAPAPIAVFRGPDHVFQIANAHYLELIGNRQVIGATVRLALPELEGQGLFELLDRVYASGEPFVGTEVPVMIDRGAGKPEEGFFNFIYQPLLEEERRLTGIAVVAADVTVQVRARTQLEEANSQLLDQAAELEEQTAELEQQFEESQVLAEELQSANDQLHEATLDAERARTEAENANKAKSEFLANMSHELRTPLNAIGGYAELLTEGIRGPINGEQAADLDRIKRSQRHLLSLINDILNFAKIEAGRVRIEARDVSLNEVLGGLEALVAPQLLQKRIRYQYHCCDSSFTAYVDPERLQQILLNLLSNAVKFTPPDGKIIVECGPSGNAMRVRVRDTGVGIPADKLQTIFEPFVQLERGHIGAESGTGLGLAISRDLARAMGGDLAAESTLEKGSTFTLSVPRGK